MRCLFNHVLLSPAFVVCVSPFLFREIKGIEITTFNLSGNGDVASKIV